MTKRSTNYSSNRPLRAAADPQYDAAMAQMRALLLAPGSMPAMPQFAPLAVERVTKIAMHGGAGRGERRLAPSPKQPLIRTHPAPDMSRVRLGHKRVDETVVAAPVRAAGHAVAGSRIAAGLADLAALAEARRLADERRGS